MINIPKLSIEEIDLTTCIFIDVRSPSEYAEYHLPQAHNIPIFTNQEREIVGTIFKQQGVEEAKKKGLEFISPKLPAFYAQIRDIKRQARDGKLVIYCWRGGMRSRTVVTLLQLLGITCYQLEGGIRSYRRMVVKGLNPELYQDKKWIVLAGHTGTGKTKFLHKLKEEGYPVLDLEGLANNRGSVFGHIGLARRSQKEFEALLWEHLQQMSNSPYYIVEAESKRIGNITLPDFIMEGKRNGRYIILSAPLNLRVEHIIEMYQPEHHEQEIRDAINKLNKRLTSEQQKVISAALDEKNFRLVLALLMEHYYDPRYKHASLPYQDEAEHIHIENWTTGYEQVKAYVNHIMGLGGIAGGNRQYERGFIYKSGQGDRNY